MDDIIYIAIPSHMRPEQLQHKTLKLLKDHNFDFSNIYVFVSPESHDSYQPIAGKWGFNLIQSYASIFETRNHIIQYFPENACVVEMDDDIEDIMTTLKDKESSSVSDLQQLFRESFRLLPNSQGLWGFNANTNRFFTNGMDKFGLYSIINSCLGYRNDKRIALTVPEKEDFERCIQFYKLGLPILKRGGWGIKTKYWKNKGGIQAHYDFAKRKQVQQESAKMIMEKYPGVAYERKRSNGIIDIRFRSRDPLRIYASKKIN